MGMIAAHELRIGNWIDYLGKLVKCDIRTIYAVCKVVGESTMYRPIPLTPEILVGAKFHKDNYGLFEKVKDDKPYISGCEIELWVKQCDVNGEKVWDVCIGEDIDSIIHLSYKKYLHQLQNLYFALTNEELKIEL